LQDPFISPINVKGGTREDVSPDSKELSKQQIKLWQILKNATERQCFGQFMKIFKNTDTGECYKITSTKTTLEVCVNGLLMSEADSVAKSPALSLYGYVADDADILDLYRRLGIDPYHRIKCYKWDLLANSYHLYCALEHMNDYHQASFKEIGPYLETKGL
jgi:hypothetical protein